MSDDITDLVIEDIKRRREVGIATYGHSLRAHDGRDSLLDAYEEALDLAQYLKKALIERTEPGG